MMWAWISASFTVHMTLYNFPDLSEPYFFTYEMVTLKIS